LTTSIATDLRSLLGGQLDAYVALGYPALAGMEEFAFRDLAEKAIRSAKLAGSDATASASPAMPALLVVTSKLIAPEFRVPLLCLDGSDKPGIVDKNHDSDARKGLSHYAPRPRLNVPDAPMYVVLGLERGDEFRDVAPRDALQVLAERGRTPLTIDEGISLATVAPQLLIKNHCFMLAGSTRGDKRVPALWIADKAPKLGWCFEGVPHSWLGVASAMRREPTA
jgi:hypothetical protein